MPGRNLRERIETQPATHPINIALADPHAVRTNATRQ
jgi:hypothetical protein